MSRFGSFARSVAKAIGWPNLRPLMSSSGGWVDVTPAQPPGYFQLDIRVRPETVLAFPPVFSCVTLIANDIAKMRTRLMSVDENGIWKEITSAAFSPVLRRPNRYQNHIQFKQSWIISKLTHGNAYALKQRDGRGVVIALYLLDPAGVTPLVAPDGSVYYQLTPDNLTGIEAQTIIVPADEIIHDRADCLFHPLVGVSPLFAANLSAVQGNQIQKDSSTFFSQGAKPGGVLTAPGQISDQTARQLKESWATNYGGINVGKVAVLADGLKYEPIRMSAVDSQLTEQLRITGEWVAQTFHVPPYKLGIGELPAGQKVGDLNQMYYDECLQILIEAMEQCLDDGLALPVGMRTELDLENLLRMDPATHADVTTKLVKGGVKTPNEGRASMNLPPLEGGDTVYLQQQDIPLEQARMNVAKTPAPAPSPTPAPEPEPVELSDEDKSLIAEARAIVATQKAIDAMRRAALPEAVNV